ncbi:MAG: thioredoxin family protein [Candidatus Wukongarchaeota archaeon]|nr:thioredoxin family protein [Candidatus Wukongarchaeota archaeon]MDO8127975.1 thioredoxin family protein [Candidatus Wukongarchaeota archaeon]
MKIELLYFEGCPTHEQAEKILREVLEEEGIDVEIELILVEDEGKAEELKFVGSPTIKINGKDVDPKAGQRKDYGLTCRMYLTDEGAKGWPSKNMIKKALEETKITTLK